MTGNQTEVESIVKESLMETLTKDEGLLSWSSLTLTLVVQAVRRLMGRMLSTPSWRANYTITGNDATELDTVVQNVQVLQNNVSTLTAILKEKAEAASLTFDEGSAAITVTIQVPTTTEAEVTTCVGDASIWDAGYGTCSTYADGQANAPNCSNHSDGSNQTATEVCYQCGQCKEVTTTGNNTDTTQATATPGTPLPPIASTIRAGGTATMAAAVVMAVGSSLLAM